MASLVARSNSDGYFSVVHLKEHVYTFPPRTIEDLVPRLRAPVTTVDTNMLVVFKRMPCGALQPGLKWTDAASNTYYKYETPMV
jgi:hypothetical protein